MSTVLIYTSPARGHLYPMMDVALAMQAAGHRVVVQTLAAEREHVQAAGIEHRPLAAAIEGIELADHRARGTRALLQAALDCWATRAPHEVDDLGATLSDLAPDLVHPTEHRALKDIWESSGMDASVLEVIDMELGGGGQP